MNRKIFFRDLKGIRKRLAKGHRLLLFAETPKEPEISTDELNWKFNSGSTCEKCGSKVKGGIFNAVEHYHDCYSPEDRRANVKKSMKEIGYNNKDSETALDNLGL